MGLGRRGGFGNVPEGGGAGPKGVQRRGGGAERRAGGGPVQDRRRGESGGASGQRVRHDNLISGETGTTRKPGNDPRGTRMRLSDAGVPHFSRLRTSYVMEAWWQ